MLALEGAMMDKKSDNPKSILHATWIVDSMEELRTEYMTDQNSHCKRLHASICEAYALALVIQRSDGQWNRFLKMDWKDISGGPPKAEQRKEVVRFTLKFMVGKGKEAQKDASLYYRAIKSFADEGMPASKLDAYLKSAPLRVLANQQAKIRKKAHPTPTPDPDLKTTRRTISMPKTIKSESVSELPPKVGKDLPMRAACVLFLNEQQQKTLLSMPKGDRITIKGKLKKMGAQIEIAVTSVKHRKSRSPAEQAKG